MNSWLLNTDFYFLYISKKATYHVRAGRNLWMEDIHAVRKKEKTRNIFRIFRFLLSVSINVFRKQMAMDAVVFLPDMDAIGKVVLLPFIAVEILWLWTVQLMALVSFQRPLLFHFNLFLTLNPKKKMIKKILLNYQNSLLKEMKQP